MRAQRSQRGKQTECPQIFAALTFEDDLLKLVKLLLVASIVRERVYRLYIEGYISVSPQIFAALTFEDDLLKLVKLLLVASIVRERVYRVCIEGYISVVWKTAPVT